MPNFPTLSQSLEATSKSQYPTNLTTGSIRVIVYYGVVPRENQSSQLRILLLPADTAVEEMNEDGNVSSGKTAQALENVSRAEGEDMDRGRHRILHRRH
ncbi:hypothetical protein E4U30_001819 [Claviceps sp. LM220 group G6]|nr:hypothetical protein E4U30_001819 [Claviceps sp. LM220 group G6]